MMVKNVGILVVLQSQSIYCRKLKKTIKSLQRRRRKGLQKTCLPGEYVKLIGLLSSYWFSISILLKKISIFLFKNSICIY